MSHPNPTESPPPRLPPPSPPAPPGDAAAAGAPLVSFSSLLPWQYQYPNRNWAFYRNPGALTFTLATVRGSADEALRYPVCGGAVAKVVTLLAATTCRAAGYIFGYALPYWYVPRADLDTGSLGHPEDRRFANNVRCNISMQALLKQDPLPPYECTGTLSDTCDGGYALASCIPNAAGVTRCMSCCWVKLLRSGYDAAA